MGFPCRKLNGEIVDIVSKRHDDNGTEVFEAVDGTLYTRATSDAGDMHALVDYTAPAPYSERDDADLVVQEANDGPSQADVDSTAKENAASADVPGGPSVPATETTAPADSGTDTPTEPTVGSNPDGSGPEGSAITPTASDDDNGGETLPAA